MQPLTDIGCGQALREGGGADGAMPRGPGLNRGPRAREGAGLNMGPVA